ncbi:MAG: Branched-chain-amino-acid aminotransferase, partial [Alphaproteobacteria bacterium MarineAlpha2_Bin1]
MNIIKENNRPNFVILNGKITKFNEAKISIMSPGFTFAISVFEGLRGYWNNENKTLYIFRLNDHLKRLNFSIKTVELDYNENFSEIEIQILELIRKNNIKDNIYIRLQVYADDWGSM